MTKDVFKPMLACDAFFEKITFPCIVQPKIDGVHSLNRYGACVGRSLRSHDNIYTTQKFSKLEFHGFAGEKYNADLGKTHTDLCRVTSGDLRRIEGEPNISWVIFDFITDSTKNLGYVERMNIASEKIRELNLPYLEIIESHLVFDMEQLLDLEEEFLNAGYEGIIVRDPKLGYKYGRCGKTFMGVWRVKRFIDAEFIIDEIIEGQTNENEATVNLLGRTERSTHAENMHPNGQVGTFRGRLIADVVDPQTGIVILQKGLTIDVAPGNLTKLQRIEAFENQSLYLNQIGKFKLFPKGIKDKPRFPQFQCLRNASDMSE